jgi:hypothetical protein
MKYHEFREARKNWTAPPELLRSAPRPVRLSPQGVFLAAIGVVLCLGAITAGVLLSRESLRPGRNTTRLAQEGREIDARIARLWRSKEKNRTAHVEYWFDSGGRRYRHDTRVPLPTWNTLQRDGSLSVRYLPSNPERE